MFLPHFPQVPLPLQVRTVLKYNYTLIQAPADYGKPDELQKFLNELNALPDSEIVQIVPLVNRYLLILYKS